MYVTGADTLVKLTVAIKWIADTILPISEKIDRANDSSTEAILKYLRRVVRLTSFFAHFTYLQTIRSTHFQNGVIDENGTNHDFDVSCMHAH